MSFKFNPFTGTFDDIGSDSSPGTFVVTQVGDTATPTQLPDGYNNYLIADGIGVPDPTIIMPENLVDGSTVTVLNFTSATLTVTPFGTDSFASVDGSEFGTSFLIPFNSFVVASAAFKVLDLTATFGNRVLYGQNFAEPNSINPIFLVTADYTVDQLAFSFLSVDASSGPVQITFDNVPYQTLGRRFSVSKTDNSANAVTIVGPGMISGAASVVLTEQYQIAELGYFETTLTLMNLYPMTASIPATQIGAGTVDNTEFGYLDGVTSSIQTQLNNKVDDSEKGAPGGVATLDGGGKVPVAQLPSAVMTYEGVWNASTNSPTLADGVGDAGMVYRVGTAGTQDLGSGSISFNVGDYVIYNGTIWEKSDTTDAVASVNGFTGIVVLDTDDIAEGANLYFTDERAQDAVGTILVDSASVDLTYNDATPSITATVIPGGVDRNALGGSALTIANGGTNNGALAVTAGGVVYTDGTKLVNTGAGTTGQFLKSNGASAPTWATSTFTAPTIQRFTSSSGTYTTPANVLYLKVKIVGAGGGGAGGGTTGIGSGGNGGDTTFGSNTAAGGVGASGTGGSAGGAGGAATNGGTGTTSIAVSGGNGSSGSQNTATNAVIIPGGNGGTSVFGGNGTGQYATTGAAGKTNTGGGGAGGGMNNGTANNFSGAGGGAGGYLEVIITSPAASYSYAVGAAGTAGTAGTNGSAGGAGGSGVVIVEEFYQ